MHSREREAPARRADQVASRLYDSAPAASREADGAGAVVAGVRDLEVDRHEGIDGLGYRYYVLVRERGGPASLEVLSWGRALDAEMRDRFQVVLGNTICT